MKQSIINTGILAFAFLIIFGLGEAILKFFKVKAEFTRKTVHISSGILTMLFPVLIKNHWLVLILCGSFFVILIVSKIKGYLNAIHGVDRITYGSMLFPIAVYGCYVIAEQLQSWVYFLAPIQIMAISDMLAAIVGQKCQYKPYNIFGHTKTLSGSLAFFLSAFLILLIFMLLFSPLTSEHIIFTSIVIAFITTLVEAISHKGIDNFSIPMTVLCLLYVFHIILV